MREEQKEETESIYKKFNEARRNMDDLQEIITKYSTNRKEVDPVEVNLFELSNRP